MKKSVFLSRLSEQQIENYDYFLVPEEFLASSTLDIICKKHGPFKQRSYNHQNNGRCRQCWIESLYSNTEEYIIKARKVHGDFYNYSLLEYKGCHEDIQIICPVHGPFIQNPNNHLTGYGCRRCFDDQHRLTLENFISRSQEIHQNKFDYSKVKYVDCNTYVTIICPEHGEYPVRPRSHLEGDDCPKCRIKKIRLNFLQKMKERKEEGWQMSPNFNPDGCQMLDRISEEKKIQIQHAMNGGEVYLSELGYWIDGYDVENNVVYEIYEKAHFDKEDKLLERDRIRIQEIRHLLNCQFISILI